MKRIFRIALIALCALLFPALYSCGEGAGVPKDMQLVRGGEEYGYNFYAPDGWTVSSYGDFACAYVSAVSPASVTFGEAEMPDEAKDGDGFTQEEIKAYFHARMANVGYMSSMKMNADCVKASFGNETNAYKFDFTYEYPTESGSIPYRSLQYLIVRGERLYIFQYNAQNTVPQYSQDSTTTYYDVYIAHEEGDRVVNAHEVITNFVFLDKPAPLPEKAGSDGELVLVSESSVSGFDFYAPSDSKEIISGALVHRDLGDGASVSVSKLVLDALSDETVNTDDYWLGIKSNLEKVYGEVKMTSPFGAVKGEDGSTTYPNKITDTVEGTLGGLYYEYEYTYAGVTYKAYLAILGVKDGFSYSYYAYTYTARAVDYNTEESGKLCHDMLTKMKFK